MICYTTPKCFQSVPTLTLRILYWSDVKIKFKFQYVQALNIFEKFATVLLVVCQGNVGETGNTKLLSNERKVVVVVVVALLSTIVKHDL